MWQTDRFCNSQAYISRVHGFVNDSASTDRTPVRSSSPSSASMTTSMVLPNESGVTGKLWVRPPHVERPDGVRRRLIATRGPGGRQGGDGAGERRRQRLCDRRVDSRGGQDAIAVGHRAVTDEHDSTASQ